MTELARKRPAVTLAQDLLKSLAAMQPSEIGAALAFIVAFRDNPESPGWHLHTVNHTKGAGLWSARVTDGLRAILHRTDEGWTILKIDRHEQAYAWAERRRGTRSRDGGDLEIVSVRERVQEKVIMLPVHREPLRFERHDDAYLLSIGLPADWIPVVRAARTDEDVLHVCASLEVDHPSVAERLLEIGQGRLVVPARAVAPPAEPAALPEPVDGSNMLALVGQWRQERTEPSSGWTAGQALYDDFCAWCSARGLPRPWVRDWSVSLRELGVERRRMQGKKYQIGLRTTPIRAPAVVVEKEEPELVTTSRARSPHVSLEQIRSAISAFIALKGTYPHGASGDASAHFGWPPRTLTWSGVKQRLGRAGGLSLPELGREVLAKTEVFPVVDVAPEAPAHAAEEAEMRVMVSPGEPGACLVDERESSAQQGSVALPFERRSLDSLILKVKAERDAGNVVLAHALMGIIRLRRDALIYCVDKLARELGPIPEDA